jgi:hypothetical protein
MRKLLLGVIVLAFTVAAPVTYGQESAGRIQLEPSIYCCISGKCQVMTKADCENGCGGEVNDCKDYKWTR